MGNSSSGDRDNLDHNTKVLKDAYDTLRAGNAHVDHEQFNRLFSCLPAERCSRLWRQLFGAASVMTFELFAAACMSVEAQRRDEDRLRFVLELVRAQEDPDACTEVPYIETLLLWCASVAAIDQEAVRELAASVVANFTPLDEGALPSEAAFVRWACRNCGELTHDFCTCLLESLRRGHLVMPSMAPLKEKLANSALTIPRLWIVSSCISEAFKHNQRIEGGNTLDKFNLDKMGHIHKLFDTFQHGMSSNRFRNMVFGYDAPTLTYIEFKEQSFCLALDEPYKEHWNPYSGPDTFFFSLQPKFCLLLSGRNLFYSNFTTKAGKRTLAIGRNPIQSPVVECEEGLSKGSVYGLNQELVRLEVWGCGRDAAALTRKLTEMKEFEQRDASKQKNRKLKAEAWEDSPDRHIMEWGGVRTKNSDLAGPPEEAE